MVGGLTRRPVRSAGGAVDPDPTDQFAPGEASRIVTPRPARVHASGLQSAMKAAAWMIGFFGAAMTEAAQTVQLKVPPPKPEPPDDLAFREAMARIPRFSDEKGYGTDLEGAVKQLKSGQKVYLDGTGCHGLEEAKFVLALAGHLNFEHLQDPRLAHGLSHAVTGKFYTRDWEFQGYKAVAHYSEVRQNPETKLALYDRVARDRSHTYIQLGEFTPDEIRAPAFSLRLDEGRAAVQELDRHFRDYKIDNAWKQINDPELDHAGQPLSVRAKFCGAAKMSQPFYVGLLGLTRGRPAADVLKWAETVCRVPPKDLPLALEHLRDAGDPSAYLESLKAARDPQLALRLTELRASDPKLERGFQDLNKLFFEESLQRRLFRGWAEQEGQVDLGTLVSNKTAGEFVARMWSEVPREDHERFQQFPRQRDLPFESVLAAHQAVNRDASRMSAWLQWYGAGEKGDKAGAAEVATKWLTGWPTASIEPGDARDVGQILANRWANPEKAWERVSAAPTRDLAMAVFHARVPEREEELLARGLGEPGHAAGLRCLAEGKLPMDQALQAIELLEGVRGRALPELAGDYLVVHSLLSAGEYAHRTTRAALREALRHGPEGGQALGIALIATGDLATAQRLVPLSLKAEEQAAVSLAGRLVKGNPGQTEALARLLLDGKLGPDALTALEKAVVSGTDGTPTQRVEDWLGVSAGPADSRLTRLVRGGELLRQSAPTPELAEGELASRMGAAFGGDWSAEAKALGGLGSAAVGIARQLEPASLREALPLLQALAAQRQPERVQQAWAVLTTPVGDESFGDRCRAAGAFVGTYPAGSLELAERHWCEVVDGVSGLADAAPGTELLRSTMPFGAEHFPDLLALARTRPDLGQGVSGLQGALTRLAGRLATQGYDLEAIRSELDNPGTEASRGSVLVEANAVTVNGVRLRTRA